MRLSLRNQSDQDIHSCHFIGITVWSNRTNNVLIEGQDSAVAAVVVCFYFILLSLLLLLSLFASSVFLCLLFFLPLPG